LGLFRGSFDIQMQGIITCSSFCFVFQIERQMAFSTTIATGYEGFCVFF